MFLQLLVIISVSGGIATDIKDVEESMYGIYSSQVPPLSCNHSFYLQTFQHTSKDAASFKRSPYGSRHQGENVVYIYIYIIMNLLVCLLLHECFLKQELF